MTLRLPRLSTLECNFCGYTDEVAAHLDAASCLYTLKNTEWIFKFQARASSESILCFRVFCPVCGESYYREPYGFDYHDCDMYWKAHKGESLQKDWQDLLELVHSAACPRGEEQVCKT